MALLKDISPLHAEILAGTYDADLETLRQTINHRLKVAARENGIRPGAIVELVDDPSAGNLAGKKARVIKVNQKTVSIDLLDESIPEWKRGYRVSTRLIKGRVNT